MPMNLQYTKIKALMGITHDFSDDVVLPLIDATANFCLEAGVAKSVLESDKAIGLLAIGAKDLYTFGSDSKFSAVFGMMLTQLSLIDGE